MADETIDRYLVAFNDALVAGPVRRDRILAEVEAHLRDSAQALVATGVAETQAEAEALSRFGAPAEAAERFGPDPSGRALQAWRRYDGWRVSHPWAVAAFAVLAWGGFLWWMTGPSLALSVTLPMICAFAALNLAVRRRAEPGFHARRIALSSDRRRLFAGMGWAQLVATVALLQIAQSTSDWFNAIAAYYLACTLLVAWSRPGRRRGPMRPDRIARWVDAHASAARVLRGAGWALALAGPALAEIVPLTAGHFGAALFVLTVFIALAPAPTRRSEQWLCARRPALMVALRSVPVLVLAAVWVARDPGTWPLLVSFGALVAARMAYQEHWRSWARTEATRRRLRARVEDAPPIGS